MTRKQQEFYRFIINQMVDFNEDFHKEFTLNRIKSIEDDQLKYLLEEITKDKDKVGKKGYLTYSKFVYYADKIIKSKMQNLLELKESLAEQLYQKRDWLLRSIMFQAKSIEERNQLIQGLQERKLMFNQDGKNILNECDYFIIDRFGFFNFFDENKNYHIKEEIEKYYQEYIFSKQNKKNETLLLN